MKRLDPRCICGRHMAFPPKRNRARCPSCGVRWEQGKSGYWAVGLRTISFTPRKPNHYEKYMRWLESQKGRKAGRRGKEVFGF
jgi:hypothetical protein